MKDLVDAVAEADSPYALVAIFLLGCFVLLWRYGGKLISAVEENTKLTRANGAVAKEANQTVTDVRAAIITNHGSRNIGDAIDRITENLIAQGEAARADREHVKALQQAFLDRALDGENLEERVAKKFGEMDDRLSSIEALLHQNQTELSRRG